MTSLKSLLILAAALPVFVAVCQTASRKESPFACDRMALNAEQRHRHFDELGPQLRHLVKTTRETADGYEFLFPSDPETFRLVAEWTAGEHLCCPFFDIDLRLEREGGEFWLRLSGRDGVKQFIHADFSPWFRHS
ncbi:MAG TPA: hypothetical protein VKU01_03040 [Bryobacteraceae bacterium]|nr:hypothetical protein [Bryobacteraceae bacterium]